MRLKPARFLSSAIALVLVPTLAGAVLDPAVKCHAAKLKLSGKYAACRLLEDAAATKAGTTPDYTTCDEKLAAGWAKAEAAAAGACPTDGDLAGVQDSLVECVGAPRWIIRFHVTSTHAIVGALQFEADYSASNGEFPGSSSGVVCQNSVPNSLFADFDDDSAEMLRVGVVSMDGFSTPQEIARCMFEANDLTAPLPSQFTLTLTDATDTNGNPLAGVNVGVTVEQSL